MGNKGVKAKLDRKSSKFLGGVGDPSPHQIYLTKFYKEEMTGDSFEKFEILKDLHGENEEISKLIELPTDHENMCVQGGFFD